MSAQELYFFDLDGTLLDHERAQAGGLDTLVGFDDELRIYAREELVKRWQQAEDRHFPRFQSGEISYEEHRRERLREVFPMLVGQADRDLDSFYAAYLQGYNNSWHFYDEAEEVLSSLTAQPKVLITNGDSAHQRAKVERLELDRYFDEVIVSSEVGFAKPAREIFEKACASVGVAPSDVTFVGDNFLCDVVGSSGAGMRAVWINRNGKTAPAADVEHREIRSLRELSDSVAPHP